ncbi:MAG: oxidoreductase [Caldilineaceae bacterium]
MPTPRGHLLSAKALRHLAGGRLDTTPDDAKRIRRIRRSHVLIAIGARATAGGIQALRNSRLWMTTRKQSMRTRTTWTPSPPPRPSATMSSWTSELRYCPIAKRQLLEVVNVHLNERKPNIPTYSVCMECKAARQTSASWSPTAPSRVATQAGCGALCPALRAQLLRLLRPMETPNPHALSEHFQQRMMMAPAELVRLWRTFNADAAAFREESERYEHVGNENDHR